MDTKSFCLKVPGLEKKLVETSGKLYLSLFIIGSNIILPNPAIWIEDEVFPANWFFFGSYQYHLKIISICHKGGGADST